MSICVGWNYLSISKLQQLHRWSLGMDKLFHPALYNGCDYLSMLGLKVTHVSKRGHSGHTGSTGTICCQNRCRVTSSPRHIHSDPDLSLAVLTTNHNDQQKQSLITQVHVNCECNEWNTKAKSKTKILKCADSQRQWGNCRTWWENCKTQNWNLLASMAGIFTELS